MNRTVLKVLEVQKKEIKGQIMEPESQMCVARTAHMVVPKIMSSSVEILSVHSNDLRMIPGDSLSPGSYPQKDRWIVRKVSCQTLENLCAISLG